MKLSIIRHGESTSDVEDRYGGNYEDHLTERGIRHIIARSKWRTKETAEIVSSALHRPCEFVSGWRERNRYGILTGMVKSEALARYPQLVEMLHDPRSTIEAAEPYDAFVERIDRAWRDSIGLPYHTIAVISHGGPIKRLFREVLRLGELNDLADCAIIDLATDGVLHTILSMDGVSFRDKMR